MHKERIMTELIKNRDIDIKKRKCENTLIVCGYATLVLTTWGILKSILYFSFAQDIKELFGDFVDNKFVVTLTLIVLGIFITVDLIIRLYIYRCAISEGRGTKKRGYFYVVLAGVIAISSIASIIVAASPQETTYQGLEKIVTMIVDAVSVMCNIELIHAAVSLKKINKETIGNNGEVND